MFEVGQMVVVVRTEEGMRYREYCERSGFKYPEGCTCLEEGKIYTIRGFRPHGSNLSVYVEEVINPIGPAGFEWGYHKSMFRPVRKTSIEELRKLVAPVPRQPVPAE